MPHSPRWYDNRLWVLNSGTGHLGTVDLVSGEFTPRAFCPGFLRRLAFHNNHAVVGLSLSRDGSFSGLALDDEMKKRDADGWCGVQIVNLGSGDIVQWIRSRARSASFTMSRCCPACAGRWPPRSPAPRSMSP